MQFPIVLCTVADDLCARLSVAAARLGVAPPGMFRPLPVPEEDWEAVLREDEQALSAAAYNVAALRRDAESDLAVLRELRERVRPFQAAQDPKFQKLIEELEVVAREAE